MSKAPTYQFAEINGTKFHYDLRGSGPTIVLIHSGVSDLRFWDAQADVFAERYQVLRYDLRGSGQTPGLAGGTSAHDDLRALLDHLNIDEVVVVGCSVGGGAAIDFSLNNPARVRALISVAAAVGGYEPDKIDEDALAERKAIGEAVEKAYEAGDLEKAATLYARVWMDGPKRSPEQVDPAIRTKAVQMLVTMFELPEDEDEEYLELEPNSASRLSEIGIPTLVIIGDYDVARLIFHADFISENIPNAEKVIMHGVAHYPNMEKPEEFNKIVLDFLDFTFW
ncbi:alpha/beta hydrolase [Chloroflexi bacterium TSY]|nr:alpha/beta hydrolase [Chloroflexi bacterium TSY]